MGGKSGQTIGYHYLFSILFGLGRGPINELREIMVAIRSRGKARCATATASDQQARAIQWAPEGEGGIQGSVPLFFGRRSSAPWRRLGELRARPDERQSDAARREGDDHRRPDLGIPWHTMLWYDGLISSMNPYPKEWSFRVRRYSKPAGITTMLVSVKAAIFLADGHVHAMNPAHIIYQCLTDPIWGRGLPPR
jgi:hypothetical protein